MKRGSRPLERERELLIEGLEELTCLGLDGLDAIEAEAAQIASQEEAFHQKIMRRIMGEDAYLAWRDEERAKDEAFAELELLAWETGLS